ncbi:hypothetical protein WH47_09043 [Habropoda laboriosa]|uniref:Uncharacterized protein n=1 Tax=Habropoda laboriosa TaxID=597456 RepID=A0A0L7QLY7_9HYME|nr:hypothetical protein WH47_09043 [Habropoda laboriosa]
MVVRREPPARGKNVEGGWDGMGGFKRTHEGLYGSFKRERITTVLDYGDFWLPWGGIWFTSVQTQLDTRYNRDNCGLRVRGRVPFARSAVPEDPKSIT